MTEGKNRASALSAAGDGALLLCAMMGFTASFLTLYGDGSRQAAWRATTLDLCAAWLGSFLVLAAVFALASLAVWSLPRFRALTAGGTAVFLGAAAALNGERVVQGAGLIVRAVSVVFAREVSWGREFLYDPVLTRTEEGAAARLFLTLALALLALILGWAVVRARRWWLVLALTLPPLLPGLLADLFPNWPALMALSACWCAMLLCDLCKWSAPDRRGRLTLVMLPAAALVLAAITLLFPREGYTRPEWALSMEADLRGAGNRVSDFFSRFDGPFRTTVTYVGAAEEADLASAGPLSYTGRTALRVESDYEGRLYLRGTSLAVYDGGRWTGLPEGAYEEYRTPGQLAVFPLYFPVLGREDLTTHWVTVDNVGAVGSCVYAPYFLLPQDVDETGVLPMEDAYLARRQGQWVHTLTFAELPEPDLTAEEKTYFSLTGGQGVTPGRGDYADFAYDHYLGVPEELWAALYEVTRSHRLAPFLGAASVPNEARVSYARMVAQFLDEWCEYDVSAPAAPPGTDPVEWFLTGSRRGYCMHFASAAVLMLRRMGIPARYVSGFTAECVPGQTVSVPDRAAHAWVEVWLDGFGWYPVEVTPAAAFEWYGQGPAAPEELPSVPLPESGEPTPAPTPSAPPESHPGGEAQFPGEGPEDGASTGGAPRALLRALAAAGGGAALLWLAQFLLKYRRRKKLSGPDRNRAALEGYGYLRRMERWGGRMDERAVELAQKARFSQHTLTGEELEELRSFVDRERERLCVVLGPVQRLIFRYLWGMPRRKKAGTAPKKPG